MTDPNEQESTPADAEASPSKSTDDKVSEMKATVDALGRQDKMILFGSIALVVLFLLPWYSVSASVMGLERTDSTNGLHELAWLGWFAAIAALVLALTKAGILGSMPPGVVAASRNTGLMVVLTGLALLAGPLYFWSKVGSGVSQGVEGMGVDAGKTFFFVLALLAALTAAGGAVWKLMEERKPAS